MLKIVILINEFSEERDIMQDTLSHSFGILKEVSSIIFEFTCSILESLVIFF